MAANGISTQALKRTRQDQKLALANADRTARNVVEAGRTQTLQQMPLNSLLDIILRTTTEHWLITLIQVA